MSTDQDVEGAVRLWVAQGSHQLPDRALDAALDEIATTKQRHAGWLARRSNLMNGNALKFGAAAVAIIAAAILGVRFLPEAVGGPPDPTPTPTAVAGTLASGSFTAGLGNFGRAFDIEATRTGDEVSGTLEVSDPEGAEGAYSVDLQCAQSTEDGLLAIGGELTESTYELVSEGAYVVITFASGTSVRTLMSIDVLSSDEVPSPAESCSAYLETLLSDPEFVAAVNDDGVPIGGELELGQ